MLEELKKYESIIVIYSSFIVAGSFLHMAQAFSFHIFLGWLLFLSGLSGVLSCLFGAASQYLLNILKSNREKGRILLVQSVLQGFFRYLKNSFENVTFFTLVLFFFAGACYFCLVITNPSVFLSYLNVTNLQDTEKIVYESLLVYRIITTFSVLIFFVVVLASFLFSIPTTLDDIIWDYKSINFKPHWVRKLEKFKERELAFSRTRKGKLLILLLIVSILIIYIKLILPNFKSYNLFK